MNAPFSETPHCQASQTKTKVVILIAEGVSLTTISTTLEPFQQANKLLGWEKFNLTLVSITEKNPVTSAGVPVPCQTSSIEVFNHQKVRLRPDLAILCCGQTIAAGDTALLHDFLRNLTRFSVPVFALGASSALAAAAGLIRQSLRGTRHYCTTSCETLRVFQCQSLPLARHLHWPPPLV